MLNKIDTLSLALGSTPQHPIGFYSNSDPEGLRKGPGSISVTMVNKIETLSLSLDSTAQLPICFYLPPDPEGLRK